MGKFVDSGIKAEDYAKATEKDGVQRVRVVDNVELMPSGIELSIAFKMLVFDEEGKFIETQRCSAQLIKIK